MWSARAVPSVNGMTILIADPSVADIPVHDNLEPLVDLTSLGIACVQPPGVVDHGRFVRAGLADRLVAADAALPLGVRILVVEGFRSVETQLRIFRAYSDKVRAGSPALAPAEVRREASRYVAPLEVAPHVAGAAVDLSLIDLDGRRLDMGTVLDARAFDAVAISAEARANRQLLSAVLTAAGLVNYPTEWWHWSYGDRYWAFATGAERACYGTVPSEWTP